MINVEEFGAHVCVCCVSGNEVCGATVKIVVVRNPLGAGTQAALSVLLECAAKHNLYGIRKGHRGQTRIYALQGVNRVNVPVAYDMALPMEVPPGIALLVKKSMITMQRGRHSQWEMKMKRMLFWQSTTLCARECEVVLSLRE